MLSPKRLAAPIDRHVVPRNASVVAVCGQLGHNRPKCPAAPAATANLVVDNNIGCPNDVTAVTEVVPPLLLSHQLKITTSILIWEVSGSGNNRKEPSELFWTNPVWKLRMLVFLIS
jgi:hypothetical protein